MNKLLLHLLNTMLIVSLSMWLHAVSADDSTDYGFAAKSGEPTSEESEEAQQEECD